MTAKVNAKTLKARKRNRKRKLRNRLVIIVFILFTFIGYKYKEEIFFSELSNKKVRKEDSIENKNYLDKIPEEVKMSNDPIIENLIIKAKSYPKVLDMLNNIEKYPEELLELASRKDESIDFVYNYTNYDSSSTKSISINKDYKKGEIPLFIQWDERWGYEKYGSEFLAINGCGPTALSMIVVGLTGNKEMNPKAVADFSLNNGYLVDGIGSTWTLMSEGASQLGVESRSLPLNRDIILNTLEAGQPIIATMGPGTFTQTGHFLVLTGVDRDGKIIVNDSDSKERSEKTWDIEIFMNETENLWTFTAI